MQKNYFFIVGVAVLALTGLMTLWYSDFDPFASKDPDDEILNIDGFTIAPSITDTSIPAPKVPRKVAFPSYMPKEVQKIIKGRIDTLADQIEEDPTNINVWLDLALQYKAAEDVEGAKEAWEYLTQAAPKHGLGFYNLGYLYHISLKDYPKSEEYYEKALAIDPNQELYYTALHELYRYSYKQSTNAAVDILKDGMKQLPNSINLRLTLAGYYRDDKKDNKNAAQYFTQARDMAKEAGNDQLAITLDKEISALR